MPTITLDLDTALAAAKQRLKEANDLSDNPPATTLEGRKAQRDALLDPITQLNEAIIALEAVRDERHAAEVIVDAPTAEEVARLQTALGALDRAIRLEESFAANLAILTAVLGAVPKITGAAKTA